MFKPSTIILLLSTFTTSLAFAMGQDSSSLHSKYTKERDSQKLVARDAITLSIWELRESRKFINAFPRLKTVQLINPQPPNLMYCVEGLIFELSEMKSALYRVRHLKKLNLLSDADTVKRMMGHVISLGNKCSNSLKNNVEDILLLMLTRKLEDLSMVIDNAINHVSKLERGWW